VCVLAGLLLLTLTGCIPVGDVKSNETDVPFSELTTHASKYTGQRICTQGVYLSAFEINALAASTYQRDGATYLTEPTIWIEGTNFALSSDCITSDTRPPMKFCQARVCGLFEAGGSYGHLGGYPYQIEAR